MEPVPGEPGTRTVYLGGAVYQVDTGDKLITTNASAVGEKGMAMLGGVTDNVCIVRWDDTKNYQTAHSVSFQDHPFPNE